VTGNSGELGGVGGGDGVMGDKGGRLQNNHNTYLRMLHTELGCWSTMVSHYILITFAESIIIIITPKHIEFRGTG
jgi:hypothetical protein